MENKKNTPEKTIHALQQALAGARQTGEPEQVMHALSNLGRSYLENADAPKALTQLEAAITIATDLADRQAQARLFAYKGQALKLIGNYSLALQAFRKSKGYAQKSGNKTMVCDSLTQMGMALSDSGQTEKAISHFVQAIEIAEVQGDNQRKMHLARLLAGSFYSIESYDKAVEYYVIAYEIARKMNNRRAECFFLIKVGNIFLLEGEAKAARGQYERALNIASEIEDHNAEISALGGLLRSNAVLGEITLATVYGERVIDLAHGMEHFEAEISNINSLAALFIQHERYQDALPYLERGLEVAQAHQDDAWVLEILTAMGSAHFNLGAYDLAGMNYHQALTLSTRMGSQQAEGKILSRLSALQAEQGKLAEAIDTALRALAIAYELEDFFLAGVQQMLLALNYRDLGEIAKAKLYCQDALATYAGLKQDEQHALAQNLLAELDTLGAQAA